MWSSIINKGLVLGLAVMAVVLVGACGQEEPDIFFRVERSNTEQKVFLNDCPLDTELGGACESNPKDLFDNKSGLSVTVGIFVRTDSPALRLYFEVSPKTHPCTWTEVKRGADFKVKASQGIVGWELDCPGDYCSPLRSCLRP
ncbi:MAG: hypothetical protein HY698_10855 [Deltaproteobacteria bacterium]|nr:hypothetical protein [Deltaproteobacteria bacterium]